MFGARLFFAEYHALPHFASHELVLGGTSAVRLRIRIGILRAPDNAQMLTIRMRVY
jgi:hypothetical protein